MLKRFASCSLMILLFAALVAAHGEPILGTVTAVGKDTVTIKDNKTGKPVIIMLEKNTKYLINKKAATLADLEGMVRYHTHHHHPVGEVLKRELKAYADELKSVQVFKQSTDTAKFAERIHVDVFAV